MKRWLLLIAIAAAGCTPSEEPTLFQERATQSGINFRNDLAENEGQNIVDYLYFYNGAGVAVADFNRDGLEDIYFVRNQGPNALYWNKGIGGLKKAPKLLELREHQIFKQACPLPTSTQTATLIFTSARWNTYIGRDTMNFTSTTATAPSPKRAWSKAWTWWVMDNRPCSSMPIMTATKTSMCCAIAYIPQAPLITPHSAILETLRPVICSFSTLEMRSSRL